MGRELKEWAAVVVGVPVLAVLLLGDMLISLARGTTADRPDDLPAERPAAYAANDP